MNAIGNLIKKRLAQFGIAARIIKYLKGVKTALKRTVWRIVFVFDSAVITFAHYLISPRSVRNVVFIRTDGLGDFVLWIPAATALREQWPWPGHRFVVIVNANWTDLARSLKIFDDVLSIDEKKFLSNASYRISSIFWLGRLSAELVVNTIRSREATLTDTVARAINAPQKIAATGNLNSDHIQARASSDRWYRQLIHTEEREIHEVVWNNNFVETAFNLRVDNPWRPISLSSQTAIPKEIHSRRYIVFSLGAGHSLRIWPAKYFSELAKKIGEQTSLPIALIGLSSDKHQANTILQNCKIKPLDFTGKLDLESLTAVLQQSLLTITNETGTAHLSAMLGVPTICVVGGGHFGRFVPYPAAAMSAGITMVASYHKMPCFHCDWRCIYSTNFGDPVPCITNVSVDGVWANVEKLLYEHKTLRLI